MSIRLGITFLGVGVLFTYGAAMRHMTHEEAEAAIQKACKAAGHEKVIVYYSMNEGEDDKGNTLYINVNTVAVNGKCILTSPADSFFGGKESKDYRSKVLLNPTWLDVAVCCNEMILTTKDEHHQFLEDLQLLGLDLDEDDCNVYEFVTGS